MPSPRAAPAVLNDDWRGLRWQQTLALLDKLCVDERLTGDLPPYLNNDTHAHAKDLLRCALRACKENDITEKHDTGSPVCWAVVLAQQAFAWKYGWEQSTEDGARSPYPRARRV